MVAPIFCRNQPISGDKWLLPFSGLSLPLSSHVPGLWLSELQCTSLHQEETRTKMKKKVDENKFAKKIDNFVEPWFCPIWAGFYWWPNNFLKINCIVNVGQNCNNSKLTTKLESGKSQTNSINYFMKNVKLIYESFRLRFLGCGIVSMPYEDEPTLEIYQ